MYCTVPKCLFKSLKKGHLRVSYWFPASLIKGNRFFIMSIFANLKPKSKRFQQLCEELMPNQFRSKFTNLSHCTRTVHWQFFFALNPIFTEFLKLSKNLRLTLFYQKLGSDMCRAENYVQYISQSADHPELDAHYKGKSHKIKWQTDCTC